MSCPTCGHTMQRVAPNVAESAHGRFFWCPQCGTISEQCGENRARDEMPRLTFHVRTMVVLGSTVEHAKLAEFCLLPGQRPKTTGER